MRRPAVARDDLLARLFQWLDTEQGMMSIKAIDDVGAALEEAHLDIGKRRIVWPDGKRLTIDQTVRRIQSKTAIDFNVIESHVLCWLEMRSNQDRPQEKQRKDFGAWITRWIEDHKRGKSET